VASRDHDQGDLVPKRFGFVLSPLAKKLRFAAIVGSRRKGVSNHREAGSKPVP
jgi:hypothetical protein